MENFIRESVKKCVGRVYILGRWLLLAGVCGVVLGFVAGLFGRCITIVTGFRQTHEWMLYLLPLAGLVIVAMYRFDPYKSDTNRVLEGIQSGKYVPLRMSPLIIASTILTHACGGSAGREGAALQLGGSLGGTIGKWLKLDEYDQKAMIIISITAVSRFMKAPAASTIALCHAGLLLNARSSSESSSSPSMAQNPPIGSILSE